MLKAFVQNFAYNRARKRIIRQWRTAAEVTASGQASNHALGMYHGLDLAVKILANELGKK